MADLIANMQAVAGAGGGEALYVEDVFSTYLYTGTDPSNQTITNGIDLDGEGGLVWIKDRSTAYDHALYDTERGIYKYLESNQTGAEVSNTTHLRAFNSDGFDIGVNLQINSSGDDYASWTFRKAPKFFDVVTYTGDGTSDRQIAHNLGAVPGCIMVKSTSFAESWTVYHRSTGNTKALTLETTAAAYTNSGRWNNTTPTDSVFTVGGSGSVNQTGESFVAYLFAHNDGDGGFGEDADQDIIKCGSFNYTGFPQTVDIGFEPQWLLVKRSDDTGDWFMYDTMRGFTTQSGGTSGVGEELRANTNGAATNSARLYYGNATGFNLNLPAQGDYIYIAIRRGPMKTPTSGTEVFAIDTRGSTGDGNTPAYRSTFPVDLSWYNKDTRGSITSASARLTGNTQLYLELTNSEAVEPDVGFDHMNGMLNYTNTVATAIAWMFRRAPGFFDVVAYEGNSTSGRGINHNLGSTAEFIWVKCRSSAEVWRCFHKTFSAGNDVTFNSVGGVAANGHFPTVPDSDNFYLGAGNQVNGTGKTYIAYLFATVPNVSKVGSYTGNGTSQTIDCGFSTGARFVLIKRTDSTSNWNVFDTTRGIVAGNDSRLELNTQDAQDIGDDGVDPDSSGFAVNYIATNDDDVNVNGGTYIFLAIA